MEADQHQPIGEVDRLAKRYINAPQDAQCRATFYPGRFFKVLGDSLKSLPQQKNPEGGGLELLAFLDFLAFPALSLLGFYYDFTKILLRSY